MAYQELRKVVGFAGDRSLLGFTSLNGMGLFGGFVAGQALVPLAGGGWLAGLLWIGCIVLGVALTMEVRGCC